MFLGYFAPKDTLKILNRGTQYILILDGIKKLVLCPQIGRVNRTDIPATEDEINTRDDKEGQECPDE